MNNYLEITSSFFHEQPLQSYSSSSVNIIAHSSINHYSDSKTWDNRFHIVAHLCKQPILAQSIKLKLINTS